MTKKTTIVVGIASWKQRYILTLTPLEVEHANNLLVLLTFGLTVEELDHTILLVSLSPSHMAKEVGKVMGWITTEALGCKSHNTKYG